jgi:hypothetical protein
MHFTLAAADAAAAAQSHFLQFMDVQQKIYQEC